MERTTYWVARPSSKVSDTTVGEAAMTRTPDRAPPRIRRKVAARPTAATRRRRSVFNSSMIFNSDLLRLTVGAGRRLHADSGDRGSNGGPDRAGGQRCPIDRRGHDDRFQAHGRDPAQRESREPGVDRAEAGGEEFHKAADQQQKAASEQATGEAADRNVMR